MNARTLVYMCMYVCMYVCTVPVAQPELAL